MKVQAQKFDTSFAKCHNRVWKKMSLWGKTRTDWFFLNVYPVGRMDRKADRTKGTKSGMRAAFGCQDKHLLTFLVGENCSGEHGGLWSPPGTTRLNGWQSVRLGKASSFYWSIFSIPRSCQPLLPNWPSLWNTWYGGWAGRGSVQDQSGGQKCCACCCTAMILICPLPTWIPFIFHKQTPGLIHLALFRFTPDNLVLDNRHGCIFTFNQVITKKEEKFRQHSKNVFIQVLFFILGSPFVIQGPL